MSARKKVSFEDWDDGQEKSENSKEIIIEEVQKAMPLDNERSDSDNNKSIFDEAVRNLNAGINIDLVIKNLKMLIQKDCTNAKYYFKLGHYYTYLDDDFQFEDAKWNLEKALHLTPNDSRILDALIFCKKKNRSKKKERLDKVFGGLYLILIFILIPFFCYYYWNKFGWWSLLWSLVFFVFIVVIHVSKENILLKE